MRGPLITLDVHESLQAARARSMQTVQVSLDLDRTMVNVRVHEAAWDYDGVSYPYLARCRDRTVYHWTGAAFAPVSRFGAALVKLVPTQWGPPTFEIDGIKMLPTAQVSPWEDARSKVEWIRPGGACILDTCGGLGYFAAACVAQGATRVLSFEKSVDVLWLRELNPWSPAASPPLELVHADVTERIDELGAASFDAVLHDPPRFGTAGELYSATFYGQLARVLRPGGRLFHYTGHPNRLTSGRNVPREVARRLQAAGFDADPRGDGVLATRQGEGRRP